MVNHPIISIGSLLSFPFIMLTMSNMVSALGVPGGARQPKACDWINYKLQSAVGVMITYTYVDKEEIKMEDNVATGSPVRDATGVWHVLTAAHNVLNRQGMKIYQVDIKVPTYDRKDEKRAQPSLMLKRKDEIMENFKEISLLVNFC